MTIPYIWTKILHPKKISDVTDGSSDKKLAYETDGIIFWKWIFTLSFQVITMIHDLSQPDETLADHLKILGKFSYFASALSKKTYFDVILRVSIIMYLLPRLNIYTFETQMNV